MTAQPNHRQGERVLRPVGSMGVEYVKAGDPTRIHGVVLDTGESMWRAECMACGIHLKLQDSPWRARASARSHATSVNHRALLMTVAREHRKALR